MLHGARYPVSPDSGNFKAGLWRSRGSVVSQTLGPCLPTTTTSKATTTHHHHHPTRTTHRRASHERPNPSRWFGRLTEAGRCETRHFTLKKPPIIKKLPIILPCSTVSRNVAAIAPDTHASVVISGPACTAKDAYGSNDCTMQWGQNYTASESSMFRKGRTAPCLALTTTRLSAVKGARVGRVSPVIIHVAPCRRTTLPRPNVPAKKVPSCPTLPQLPMAVCSGHKQHTCHGLSRPPAS